MRRFLLRGKSHSIAVPASSRDNGGAVVAGVEIVWVLKAHPGKDSSTSMCAQLKESFGIACAENLLLPTHGHTFFLRLKAGIKELVHGVFAQV